MSSFFLLLWLKEAAPGQGSWFREVLGYDEQAEEVEKVIVQAVP